MHSHPIVQNKSRPRKHDQQKCTHPLYNKRNQGQDNMTSRNALTSYGTKEIKAKKACPAEMHSHPIKQKKSRPRKTA